MRNRIVVIALVETVGGTQSRCSAPVRSEEWNRMKIDRRELAIGNDWERYEGTVVQYSQDSPRLRA